jgi:hypothetical protein
MFKFSRSTVFTCNAVAVLAMLGAGVTAMGAQTSAVQPSSAPAQAALDLRLPALDTSSASLFSSSADEDAAVPVTEASVHPTVMNFAEAMQYGGGQRKRYGRTRYRGANTNADGSNKYIFFGGAGLSQPLGNTYHYLTPSWAFQVGGGRQFDKHFALPVQFDYDHFGLAGQTITNQSYIYNTYINQYDTSNDLAPGDANYISPITNLDGNSHVWSFSVDPTYTVYSGEGLGAYVVAGVGFYHKVANFTQPQSGCDPYYLQYYGICVPYTANQIIDHYTSNAPGFSGGFGLTYKFSRFSNERFYAEIRYVFVDNSQRQGVTVNNIAVATNTNNVYPANSNRTGYIPIKVGLRF